MWSRPLYHLVLLIMLGGAYAGSLSSCTKSITTEDSTLSAKAMLLRDMGNGVCLQVQAGLMWQINESQQFSTWKEANDYVATLQLAGFNDWRLPTHHECLSLIELLELKKGNCPIRFRKGHWVSSKNKHESGYWEDYPLCGGSEFHWVKEKKGAVRAVRRKGTPPF